MGLVLAACGAVFGQTRVLRLGSDVLPPSVIAKPKPEYSPEARLAKLEGSVLLSVTVDAGGQARDVYVERPLGLGLDERAAENVRHWRFRPATEAGRPVAVEVDQEVFFHPHRNLWDWHAVRAIFQPPRGAMRPVLIRAQFPATVDEEGNAAVTIAFDVDTNGRAANVRVVKSSKAKWENDVVATVRDGWRFRPGTIDGKRVAVPAWFEFVRGSHSPIPPAPIPAP